jgi:hypothetical protein
VSKFDSNCMGSAVMLELRGCWLTFTSRTKAIQRRPDSDPASMPRGRYQIAIESGRYIEDTAWLSRIPQSSHRNT